MSKLNGLRARKSHYRSKIDQSIDWVLFMAGVVLVVVVLTIVLDTILHQAAVLWP
jgi:hypothetical protein